MKLAEYAIAIRAGSFSCSNELSLKSVLLGPSLGGKVYVKTDSDQHRRICINRACLVIFCITRLIGVCLSTLGLCILT